MIAVQPKNVMWPCMRNVLKAFFKPAHSRTQVHIQTHILSPLQLSWTSCCRPLPWHQCLLCMRESLGRVRRLWISTFFEQFLNNSTFPVVVVCELELLALISFINSWLKKQEYEGVNMCIWLTSLSCLATKLIFFRWFWGYYLWPILMRAKTVYPNEAAYCSSSLRNFDTDGFFLGNT